MTAKGVDLLDRPAGLKAGATAGYKSAKNIADLLKNLKQQLADGTIDQDEYDAQVQWLQESFMKEETNIKNFIKELGEKNYIVADKYLKQVVEDKLQAKIQKYKNEKIY